MSKDALTGSPRVAAVDDDPTVLEMWRRVLAKDHSVEVFSDPLVAAEALRTQAFDVVVLDLQMPNMDGLQLLARLRELQPTTEAIVVSATATVSTAVQALKLGAYDILTKPLEDINVARNRIRSAFERKRLRTINASLAARLKAFAPDTLLVGDSRPMQKVRELLAKFAASSAPVLIAGESGTGKELAARALQAASPRASAPFVALNCAAISDTLIDSELFGHEKGAFTGAVAQHRGLFEAADRGTFFLDELGELPGATQAKLLRALQEGEIRPVGSTKAKQVDVRVVAATNVNLEKAIKEGTFREDLYYRINTFSIVMPPLRERREDVPLIAQHLLQRLNERSGKTLAGFTEDCLELMMRYSWPGNVRQLNNAVEYAATLASGERVEVGDLPAFIAARSSAPQPSEPPATTPAGELTRTPYGEARTRLLDDFDVRYLTELMTSAKGNVSEASRRSGIDRANLRRMLTRLQLEHLREL